MSAKQPKKGSGLLGDTQLVSQQRTSQVEINAAGRKKVMKQDLLKVYAPVKIDVDEGIEERYKSQDMNVKKKRRNIERGDFQKTFEDGTMSAATSKRAKNAGADDEDGVRVCPSTSKNPNLPKDIDRKMGSVQDDGKTVNYPGPAHNPSVQLWEPFIIAAILSIPHLDGFRENDIEDDVYKKYEKLKGKSSEKLSWHERHVERLVRYTDKQLARVLPGAVIPEHIAHPAMARDDTRFFAFFQDFLRKKFEPYVFSKKALKEYLATGLFTTMSSPDGRTMRSFVVSPWVLELMKNVEGSVFEGQYEEMLAAMNAVSIPADNILDIVKTKRAHIAATVWSAALDAEQPELEWQQVNKYVDPQQVLRKYGGWSLAKDEVRLNAMDTLLKRKVGATLEEIVTGQNIAAILRAEQEEEERRLAARKAKMGKKRKKDDDDDSDEDEEKKQLERERSHSFDSFFEDEDDEGREDSKERRGSKLDRRGSSKERRGSSKDRVEDEEDDDDEDDDWYSEHIDPDDDRFVPFGFSLTEGFLLFHGMQLAMEKRPDADGDGIPDYNRVLSSNVTVRYRDRCMLAAAILIDLYMREKIDIWTWTLMDDQDEVDDLWSGPVANCYRVVVPQDSPYWTTELRHEKEGKWIRKQQPHWLEQFIEEAPAIFITMQLAMIPGDEPIWQNLERRGVLVPTGEATNAYAKALADAGMRGKQSCANFCEKLSQKKSAQEGKFNRKLARSQSRLVTGVCIPLQKCARKIRKCLQAVVRFLIMIPVVLILRPLLCIVLTIYNIFQKTPCGKMSARARAVHKMQHRLAIYEFFPPKPKEKRRHSKQSWEDEEEWNEDEEFDEGDDYVRERRGSRDSGVDYDREQQEGEARKTVKLTDEGKHSAEPPDQEEEEEEEEEEGGNEKKEDESQSGSEVASKQSSKPSKSGRKGSKQSSMYSKSSQNSGSSTSQANNVVGKNASVKFADGERRRSRSSSRGSDSNSSNGTQEKVQARRQGSKESRRSSATSASGRSGKRSSVSSVKSFLSAVPEDATQVEKKRERWWESFKLMYVDAYNLMFEEADSIYYEGEQDVVLARAHRLMFFFSLQQLFECCVESNNAFELVMQGVCPPFAKLPIQPPRGLEAAGAVIRGILDRARRNAHPDMQTEQTELAMETGEFQEQVRQRFKDDLFMCKDVLKVFDEDADGEVTLDEFIEGLSELPSAGTMRFTGIPDHVLQATIEDLATEIFHEIDDDGNGVLTPEELEAHFTEHRKQVMKRRNRQRIVKSEALNKMLDSTMALLPGTHQYRDRKAEESRRLEAIREQYEEQLQQRIRTIQNQAAAERNVQLDRLEATNMV